MHESIIADDIIKVAKDKTKDAEIESATIEVGDLGHLTAEELEETLKGMVDWKLNIVKKKAKVDCSCGYVGEPNIVEKHHGSTVFECPTCGSIPKVLDGEDIKLVSITTKDLNTK